MHLTIVDLISLVASIASLILAIIAIWLSLVFFKKSSEASDKTNEASKSMMSSVEKLEQLFDKLYSDTFSMMKDTVSDMRTHIWKGHPTTHSIENELAKKTEEKVAGLKNELSKDLSRLLTQQVNTGNKLQNLEAALSTLLNKAVSETKNIETIAKEETLREYLFRSLKQIKATKRKIIADYIIDQAIEDGANPSELVVELNKMKEDGYIYFEGNRISNGTVEIKIIENSY